MKVRTSVLRGFALLALSSLTFAACDKKDPVVPIPPAITVTVSPQAVTVPVGGQATLVAFVANSTNQAVTWQSTNTAIATVDANGVVRGVAPGGPVTIIATSAADQNARAAASVTVTPGAPVTLTLVPQTAQVEIGRTVQLVGIVGGATNQTVNYTSSAPAVATVSPTGGLVTGVSAGTAVITARTAADANVFQTSTITVTTAPGTGPAQISVTPSAATVQVGGSQTFVASVSGVANTAVTWRNETPTIASFTQTGNNITATGLAAGTAVFTAISAADTTRRVQATLTVTPGDPVTQPAISIQSVTYVGGNNAGQAVVSGATIANQNLRVVVNVSAGSQARIGRVEVRLGEQVACQQVFSPPLSQTQGVQTIECVINTTQLNAEGQPLFPNAVYNLSAVAFNETGTPVATAQWGTLVLANVNVLHVEISTQPVTSTGPQFSSAGVQWHEGNVVVRASPVIFTGGQTIGSVQLCIQAVDGPAQGVSCRAATLTDGWWTATFPKASAVGGTTNGSAGITTTALRAYGTSTFTTGATGPAMLVAVAPAIAVDNVAPAAPPVNAFAANTWLGANYQFNRTNITGLTAAGLEALEVQPGVGGVMIDFFAFTGTEAQYTALGTTDAARAQAVVNQGNVVTTGSNLAGTNQPSGYILVARVRDALNNATLTRVPGTFGVDLVAPQFDIVQGVATGSPAPMTINPATAFQFDFPFVEGNVSGTNFNPLVRIVRWTSNPNATRCVNVNDHTDVTTVPTSTGVCAFVRSNTPTVAVPAADGYYEFTFIFTDGAGNQSTPQTVLVLRDNTAPTVVMDAGFTSTPDTYSASAVVRDNVDLLGWDMRLRFTTGVTLPVSLLTQVGSWGVANRVGGPVTASGTIPLWRSLRTATAGTGDLTAPVAAQLNGAGFGAFDLARNFASDFHNVDQGGNALPTGLAQLHIEVVPVSGVPDNTFCNGVARPSGDQGLANCAVTNAGTAPTQRVLRVRAVGPTGFLQPFTAVHFYRVDRNGNIWYLGASTNVVAGSVGSEFEYRWSFTADASTWQGSFTAADQGVFAVGVSSARDAFRSPTQAITVRGAARQPLF
jgi:uncharacterized protein YjdB